MKPMVVIDPDLHDAAAAIDAACRDTGFFAVPLPASLRSLRDEVIDVSRRFFALPESVKREVSMDVGGSE